MLSTRLLANRRAAATQSPFCAVRYRSLFVCVLLRVACCVLRVACCVLLPCCLPLCCCRMVPSLPSVLPALMHLMELSLYGNPCTQGLYPIMETSTLSLSHAAAPRLFVGGVRLNRAGKLEARGHENEDTVAAAALGLPDLQSFSAAHAPRSMQV